MTPSLTTLCTIEPLDVLTGADSRPLDDVGWARSAELFPTAFAGALRTLILREGGYDFARGAKQGNRGAAAASFVGVPGASGNIAARFRFAGPLRTAHDRSGFLWPMPRTLLVREPVLASSEIDPLGEYLSDLGDPRDGVHILRAPSVEHRDAERLLKLGDLAAVLRGEASLRTVQAFATHELVVEERRFGHRRSPGGVVEDGALFSRIGQRGRESFRAGHWRTSGFAGLLGGFDGTDVPKHLRAIVQPGSEHVVRLGGDGRTAIVRFSDATAFLKPLIDLGTNTIDGLQSGTRIQIYLATPAVFKDGWHPTLHDHGLRLIAAAVGRPQIIAGWDAAKGQPKPVRRAVSAGSVYIAEVENVDDARRFVANAHLGSISHDDPLYGLGLCLIGLWSQHRTRLREQR